MLILKQFLITLNLFILQQIISLLWIKNDIIAFGLVHCNTGKAVSVVMLDDICVTMYTYYFYIEKYDFKIFQ
jgi:hypothetical protein